MERLRLGTRPCPPGPGRGFSWSALSCTTEEGGAGWRREPLILSPGGALPLPSLLSSSHHPTTHPYPLSEISFWLQSHGNRKGEQ